MSLADDIFDQNIRDILNSGYSTENDKTSLGGRNSRLYI